MVVADYGVVPSLELPQPVDTSALSASHLPYRPDESIVGPEADDRVLNQAVKALPAVRGTSIDANGESSGKESRGSRRAAS